MPDNSNEEVLLHGTCVAFGARAALLRGAPGAGKSDLALRCLAAYPASDVRKLAGLRSADIEQTLGYKYTGEIIHRDDLTVL